MIEIKIVWIVVNTIAAALFSYTALSNLIYDLSAIKRWSISVRAITFPVHMVALYGTLAVAVCLFASVVASVIVTSFVEYGGALISYFLFQRFADTEDQPHTVHRHPMFHPLGAFGGFLSSTLAILFFADWRLAFLPFVLWLLLGFLCAEVAIRRYMRDSKRRGDKCDRNFAISAVNDAQGRGHNLKTFMMQDRYPFP